MSDAKLIRHVWAVTNDESLGEIRDASILVEGGRISRVSANPEGMSLPDGCEIVDGAGMIATPGLIDSHKHMWSSALRGICGDLTLMDYLQIVRQQYIAAYRPQDVRIGTYMSAIEMINGGTTSVLDHAHCIVSPDHADAALEGLRESGLGGVWAYGFCPVIDSPAFARHDQRAADAERMLSAHFPDNTGALRMGVSITEPGLLPFELTEMEIRSALDMGVKWTGHIHCGNGSFPISRGVHKLYAAGLVNHLAVMSHCNEFSFSDFEMLNEAGGFFASSPDTELYMGLSKPVNYLDAIAAGTRVALGTDTVSCMSADMFAAMRVALLFARHQVNSPQVAGYKVMPKQDVTVRDVFRWATINGARALGIDHLVGSLTPGKQADILLIRTADLNMAPVHDPVSAIVLAGQPANVDSVMIAGRFRKRGGQLIDVDLAAAQRELEASVDHLASHAHPLADGGDPGEATERWSNRITATA